MDWFIPSSIIFTITVFLFFVHELGHFLVARLLGIKVDRLSLGIGKVILSKNFKGTEYALSAFPLWSYVKLQTEPKSLFQGIIYFLAGPSCNFILVFLLTFTCFSFYGMPSIGIIEAKDASRINSQNNLILASLDYSLSTNRVIFSGINQMLTGQTSAKESLSGPASAISMGYKIQSKIGFSGTLIWAAIISLNLGLFNLLPLPPLDGGRILILLIESYRHKKISNKLKIKISLTGITLIFTLMIFTMVSDFMK